MIYVWLIFAIFIALIGIAYYYDYRNDKKEFRFSVLNVGKKILEYSLVLLILFGIKSAYSYFIPLNKTHGVEYNSVREKLGIPTIGENWENRKYDSDQFTTTWWKKDNSDGHFKKIVEYGIINAKSETDYYQNENLKGTFAWSKYDFANNTFEYFLEKPNDTKVSISKNGNLKFEKPTEISKISKSDFEKYIKE